ncbi:MAG: gamma carbonic anhydrase family protein [Myxococcota bacterium]
MVIYALGEDEPRFASQDHFVAPDAQVMGKVELGAGASVWYGCVLRGDNEWIRIGDESNVQDGSVLHTDPGCPIDIGARVTVGHKVVLHGCRIGEGSLIGMGSIILNHAEIGPRCIVGAGSLVTERKSFPEGSLVMGTPAKVVRTLRDHELQLLEASALHYVENGRRHRQSLRVMTPPVTMVD